MEGEGKDDPAPDIALNIEDLDIPAPEPGFTGAEVGTNVAIGPGDLTFELEDDVPPPDAAPGDVTGTFPEYVGNGEYDENNEHMLDENGDEMVPMGSETGYQGDHTHDSLAAEVGVDGGANYEGDGEYDEDYGHDGDYMEHGEEIQDVTEMECLGEPNHSSAEVPIEILSDDDSLGLLPDRDEEDDDDDTDSDGGPKKKKKSKYTDDDVIIRTGSPIAISSGDEDEDLVVMWEKMGERGPDTSVFAHNHATEEHGTVYLEEAVWQPREEPQPETLVSKMLPFQRQALAWMSEQEEKEWNGGILADEQGMGKTLETISLLCRNKPNPSDLPEGVSKCTLVVTPVVALMQWKNEILRHTTPGTFSVEVYHGPNRAQVPEELLHADIVLTTYSVIASDFRRETQGYRYRGETIYRTSLLHLIHWYRIVLDEAHYIKDRSAATSKAVLALEAEKRWGLSGTPLQNRVGELYSLIRFLRVDPFSFYFCRLCNCRKLIWKSQGTGCPECKHSPIVHYCWWNKYIQTPIKRCGSEGQGLEAMHTLRCILQRVMLRRTKEQCADDLALPPRRLLYRIDKFNEEEDEFYKALFDQSKSSFMSYVEGNNVMSNVAHVFELLMRLRQAVNHSWLAAHTLRKQTGLCGKCNDLLDDAVETPCKHKFCKECIIMHINAQVENPACPVCAAPVTQERLVAISDEEEVAVPQIGKETRKSILTKLQNEEWETSTKTEALLEELARIQEQKPGTKTIIFSQFVNYLDILDWRLTHYGYKCVRIDGRMNITQRNVSIDKFNNDPSVMIFLISLKAGGIALNLTIATHAFIMDPWWNPATEEQAMDRIHRLGQVHPVTVTRFIIEGTVEERIVQLQKAKKLLFQSTVGMDPTAIGRLTMEDLKYLFRV